MVMAGEFDGDGGGAQLLQLLGTYGAVVAVDAERRRQAQTHSDGQRSRHSTEHAKAGVTLADIVKGGSLDEVGSIRAHGCHEAGGVEAVTLICPGLRLKELQEVAAEEASYPGQLIAIERPRQENGKETGPEMSPRPRHSTQRRLAGHTEDRLGPGLEPGLWDLRAAIGTDSVRPVV